MAESNDWTCTKAEWDALAKPSALAQFIFRMTLLLDLLQIFFYGVTSICTSILHARKQFFAAAWTPVLANIVTIASLLLVSRVSNIDPPTLDEVVDNKSLQWLLGMGSTSGIIVMTLGMFIALRRSSTALKWNFDLSHTADN